MSAVPNATTVAAMTEARGAHALPYMQMRVRGRIESSRSHAGKRYTVIVCPAEDSYSAPQVVEVRSRGAVGSKGEEVAFVVKAGGYKRRPFRATDKDTGETSMVTPIDHTFDLVE